MIITFNDDYLEKLATGENLKGKPKYDVAVVSKYRKILKILQVMPDTAGLKHLKSLNFEALKGNLKGLFAVRVDYRYRLIFSIEKDMITVAEIVVVEDLNNHYQ